MDERNQEGQAIWDLETLHMKVHTYYDNFCPVSQKAKRWNALVIKVTYSVLSINNELARPTP